VVITKVLEAEPLGSLGNCVELLALCLGGIVRSRGEHVREWCGFLSSALVVGWLGGFVAGAVYWYREVPNVGLSNCDYWMRFLTVCFGG